MFMIKKKQSKLKLEKNVLSYYLLRVKTNHTNNLVHHTVLVWFDQIWNLPGGY